MKIGDFSPVEKVACQGFAKQVGTGEGDLAVGKVNRFSPLACAKHRHTRLSGGQSGEDQRQLHPVEIRLIGKRRQGEWTGRSLMGGRSRQRSHPENPLYPDDPALRDGEAVALQTCAGLVEAVESRADPLPGLGLVSLFSQRPTACAAAAEDGA